MPTTSWATFSRRFKDKQTSITAMVLWESVIDFSFLKNSSNPNSRSSSLLVFSLLMEELIYELHILLLFNLVFKSSLGSALVL